MRWADVDLQAGLWHIPGVVTKHGEPTVLPIVGEAAAILRRRSAQRKRSGAIASPYIFPGKGEAGHISQPKRQWAKLLEIAGISDLRIHDLRRTLGSWLAMGGASLPMIGRALGHLDSKSTAVYARMQVEPIAAAVKQAQQAMLATASVKRRARH
jgi:integrase